MSDKIVLDSCVFNKLFLQEPDREQALALFSAITQHNYRVIVPSLFLYEVLAIARVSGFSTAEAYSLIEAFQQTQLQLVEFRSAMY